MKKETRELIKSWVYVGYLVFIIVGAIWIYINHGVGTDLRFILVVDIFCGVPVIYLVLKLIKNKEFRLKKPGVIV